MSNNQLNATNNPYHVSLLTSNMKNIYILSTFLFLSTSQLIAQMYDHQWAFGYGAGEEFKFGISLLDFNEGVIDVSFLRESEDFRLGVSGSFTNDPDQGQMQLLTNNCLIKNNQWENINGPDYLHGSDFDIYCDDDYFPIYQGVVLLPDLVNDDLTHIVLKDQKIDFVAQDVYAENFYYGRITKDAMGTHHYTGKEKMNTVDYSSEDITATPNRSKDAWWVLQAKNQTNEIVKYLIDQDTIIAVGTQQIGVVFDAVEQGIGQTAFSPDGSMIAYNSEIGIHLYDFDNETGELSNYRQISYPNQANVAQGLCFSPNSRFIYVDNAEEIYQIDLLEMDAPYHIKYYRTFDGDGWPVGVGMMLPGPDCRIYISPGSTTYYLHVIHQPNEKGEACMFQARAIELPSNIPHHLPNLPNYRYLTGCDSTIEFPFSTVDVDEVQESLPAIYTYPNPVSDLLHVSLPSDIASMDMMLIDQLGHTAMTFTIIQHDDMVDISTLSSGIYFLTDAYGRSLGQKVIKVK